MGVWDHFQPKVLDPGDAKRLPLLIGNNTAATVCRMALPATAQGAIAPPRGMSLPPGRFPDDPRWTRSLPWVPWLTGAIGPWGFLAAAGLAFFNIVLPISIVRLAGSRRRFGIRALMALPLAAAVPLMLFLAIEPLLPVDSFPLLASEKHLFIAGTVAGLPIVLTIVLAASSLACSRWRSCVALAP